ncbi:MAG: hypothetical protein ACREN5_10210, partial [Gemmatimonadales bacterium]
MPATSVVPRPRVSDPIEPALQSRGLESILERDFLASPLRLGLERQLDIRSPVPQLEEAAHVAQIHGRRQPNEQSHDSAQDQRQGDFAIEGRPDEPRHEQERADEVGTESAFHVLRLPEEHADRNRDFLSGRGPLLDGFGQLLAGLEPPGGLLGQTAVHRLDQPSGHAPGGEWRRWLREVLAQQRRHGFAFERQPARERVVAHDAQGVEVAPAVYLIAAGLLRAHELRCAH